MRGSLIVPFNIVLDIYYIPLINAQKLKYRYIFSVFGADINFVRGYVSVKLKCPQKWKRSFRMPASEYLQDKSKNQEYSSQDSGV